MVQQIGDDSRGWAWTRALQGLAANEIHMCGDGSALPLVRTLAQQMGEELEVCIQFHKPTRFPSFINFSVFVMQCNDTTRDAVMSVALWSQGLSALLPGESDIQMPAMNSV